MSEITIHKDLALNFVAHPLTGNVTPLINMDAIQQSIRNLFFLRRWDIPFDPGAYGIGQWLFDPISPITAAQIEKQCEYLIKTYEWRVQLYSVKVLENELENGYDITITYRVKALNIDASQVEFFQRIR